MADTRLPPPTADGELLRLERVTRDFGDRVITRVLRGVDLVVRRGEFVALTGPSGSGKSTLLNIAGLLDRPTTGRVVLGGWDAGALGDDDAATLRGRGIGFVFQFHHLLPAFTAAENVMLPAIADRGRREPGMAARAASLLASVGLAERATWRATDLSGGEQQRVALARALAMSPPLVLADEPTGNLDTETGEQVFRLLREFNASLGTAFVIVTHDERLAARCDRIVHLVDGRIETDRVTARAPS